MRVDIRVRRCTLTIRRRSGWSWGGDPAGLVRQALTEVEAALERILPELPDRLPADLTLRQPVRLRLGPGGGADPETVARLAEELRRQLPAPAGPPTEGSRPAPEAAGPPRAHAAPAPTAAVGDAAPLVAATLAAWSRSGLLAGLLAAWPERTLVAWEATLAVAGSEPVGPAPSPGPEAVERVAAAILDGADLATPAAAAAARLLVLAAVAAMLGDRAPGPAVQARVRTLVTSCAAGPAGGAGPGTAGSPSGPAGAAGGGPAGAAGLAGPGRPEGPTPSPDEPAPAGAAGPTEARALAFLMLGQLERIGYLGAAAAALEAAGLAGRLPAFAAALAAKTVAPPGRGWRRSAVDNATLAAAAGLAEPPPGAWLAELAGRHELLLPPLWSALHGAYADGRAPSEPLTVARGRHGIVVAEPDGLLPLAWVEEDHELEALWELLGRPRLSGAGQAELGELAAALAARPGAPRAGVDDLERHLGTAVGTALGLLASDLWSAAGPTTPLLALERLGDLDALVEPGPDGFVVRLPLGRRRFDLQRAGLLRDTAVPWLPAGLRFAPW